MWFTIILLIVLWVLSMALAFIGGRFSVREEAKETLQYRPGDDLHMLEGPPGPQGAIGMNGQDGAQGPPGPSFLEEHMDDYNMTGAEWIRSVESRLTRIGRKAGLSV